MRFLSSVAFERTPRLRFAASCSAAEAMESPSSVAPHFPPAPTAAQVAFHVNHHDRPPAAWVVGSSPTTTSRERGQASAAGSAFATVVVTDPPAFCTASIAAADAPETVMVTARLISP